MKLYLLYVFFETDLNISISQHNIDIRTNQTVIKLKSKTKYERAMVPYSDVDCLSHCLVGFLYYVLRIF